MTDFKVGDKAVGVKHHDGKAVTIISAPATSRGHYIYAKLDDGYTALFLPEELELVKREPKFKVGDLVTFAEPDNEYWQGGKAEVIEGGGKTWGRFTTRVRIIESPPKNDRHRDGGAELNFDPAHLKLLTGKEAHPSYGNLYNYAAADVKFTEAIFDKIRETKPEADMVNGPSHYGGADNPYEVIKVAEAWGFNENAYLFNALKYLARAEHKGRKVEDLNKLMYYVAREVALEEAK